MPYLPVTFPQGASIATWRDFPRLLRIAGAAQMLATWRQKSLRYLFLGLAVVIIFEGWVFASLTGIPLITVVIPVLLVLATAGFMVLHTAYRLVDRRRFVLLSETGGASLDARFSTNSFITPSNLNRPGFDAAVFFEKDGNHAQEIPNRSS
ncbi:hypothetical protein ACFUCV_14790 [Specibacter sp. NPDC057265]|uniref:hypothetical protein n=1 Tax=Specibacter sp. NPDC057265 TaxID=3346075 RepID=UPI00362B5306